jgi:hypothetical protein
VTDLLPLPRYQATAGKGATTSKVRQQNSEILTGTPIKKFLNVVVNVLFLLFFFHSTDDRSFRPVHPRKICETKFNIIEM